MATSYFQDPFGAADYSAEGMPSLLSLSNLESLGRGSIAGLLGLPEDLRKMLTTKKMQENMDFLSSQSGVPQVPYFLPSSEELKKRTPRMTAPNQLTGLLEDIGSFMSPVPAAAAVPLVRGVGKVIKATEGMPVGMSIKDVGSKIKVKPATDDVYEVMDATFNYGKLGGNKTIPIDKLTGGVRMTDPTETKRVKELASKISSPDGYISRIIVDDAGNVLEGQHRLEALRLLGEKNVPVSVIEDLSNKYDISAMENAIEGKFRSDQSNQLIRRAIDTLEEAGSIENALSDYSMPAIFQQAFKDAIKASKKKPAGLLD